MTNMRDIRKKIASSILCMVLALAMIVPSAFSFDAYGLDNQAGSARRTVAAAKLDTATELTINGSNFAFSQSVITNEFLDYDKFTDTLKASGNRKSIKLKWKSVKNKNGIAGYIIVRKDLNGSTWRQIAKVNRSKKTFTDKTAKTKNKVYSYMLVPYANVGTAVKIAKPSQWASAATTKSKKKNVEKVRLQRAAKGSAVRVGATTKVAIKFCKKPVSKSIRWSSSNPAVAKVYKGTITGVSEGTATIYARTHAGYVLKFNIVVVKGGTAKGMLDVMRSWLGYSYYNQKNRGIVDIYNSFMPLPGGYEMQYYDAWCDCTISAAAIVSGNEDKIGRHCNVPAHVKMFKKMGIWIEGCKTTPQPGDIIVFNWYPSSKNNASHIGIVESVEGNQVTTLEGNMGIGILSRRTFTVGWKYVRGYARPNYILDGGDGPEDEQTPEETPAAAN